MAALGIGISDLFGRRVVAASSALTAAAGMQLIAIMASLATLGFVSSRFDSGDVMLGALSGFGLGVGLWCYFQGLAASSSTVVSPIVATLSAVIPFLYVVVRSAEASGLATGGAVVAFAGLALISSAGRATTDVGTGLRWGTISGLAYGFGLSVIVDVAAESGSWPAVSQRVVAWVFLSLIALQAGASITPPAGQRSNLMVGGVFAGLSTVFYLLGVEVDAPSAVVTTSMFPAVSVAIGYMFFRDPVSRAQLIGLGVVLVGVAGVVVG